MPSRVFVLFLAIVLLWSGLSTIEGARALAQPSPAQERDVADAGAPNAGQESSVVHHLLDDLPSLALNDPPAEPPGLLSAPLKAGGPLPTIVRPLAFVSAALGSPFLAGPLRPPCSADVAG